MKEYYKNENNRKKKSDESKKTWESRSLEQRELFKQKMSIINKDEQKRKDASEKIKQKWKDAEFLQKMKNRKFSSRNTYTIIFEDGKTITIDGLHDVVVKYDLNERLIRKFANTGEKVYTKSKTKKSINTIGLIIYQNKIKNG